MDLFSTLRLSPGDILLEKCLFLPKNDFLDAIKSLRMIILFFSEVTRQLYLEPWYYNTNRNNM